jgi:VWFA-related protein
MQRRIVLLLIVCMGTPAVLTQSTQTPSTATQSVDAKAATATREQTTTDGSPVFRLTVDLVQIDVRVTDRSGKPLIGLKPEQFTLLEDGKPQKINSFDFYDIEKIERAAAAAPPITVRLGSVPPPDALAHAVLDHRFIVLFFDLTAMQPDDLLRAQRGAEQYLREQISPADLVAVVTYGSQLKISAHFTNDRDRLLRSVRALRAGKDAQLADMAEAAPQDGEDIVSEQTGAAFTADETEFNIFNTDRKLAALESLAKLLREIPGRKLVVHFTGGIAQTGDENRVQLRATTDAANRADVSFYTVDARGLFAQAPGGEARNGSATGSAQFSGAGTAATASESSRAMFTGAAVYHQVAARHASRETLATLANDTGGRAFFDLGDLSEVFRKLRGENSSYYLLGYYSSNRKRDGSWRNVRVQVNVPGARVRYREGYYAPKGNGIASPQDRERQLLEAIRTEAPRVDFPIALETSYFRISDTNLFVPIAAKLGTSELRWASKRGRRQATFDFAAEVREKASNRVVSALRDTISVSLNGDRFEELQRHPLLYQGGMVLAPGNYRLKFVARENETGRLGMFEEDLELPAMQADKLQMSSILLSSQLEAVRDGLEVKKRSLGAEARLKNVPTEVSGERLIPSVTRVFTTSQNLYVLFQAYAPPTVDLSKLRAGLVLFRNGEWSSETPLVEPAEMDAKERTASFRLSVPLATLSAGDYALQAVVIEEGTDQAAFAQNSFLLKGIAPESTLAAKPDR